MANISKIKLPNDSNTYNIVDNQPVVNDIPNTPCDIATFTDGANLPMPTLKVSIEPIQSGSGDPSPSNVRPISGWTEANVPRCGKNLIPTGTNTTKGYVDNSYLNADGTIGSDNTLFISEYFKVPSDVNCAWSSKNAVIYSLVSVCFYDENKNFISGTALAKATKIITIPSNAVYCRSTQSKNENNKFQLELGSTATTYEPYNGHTYTIPFQDSQGNPIEVYGGECDVVSGVLTVDRVIRLVSECTWYGGNGVFYTDAVISSVKHGDGRFDHIISDVYKTQNVGGTSALSDGEISVDAGGYIQLRDMRYTTASDFKTNMGTTQLVYELATPLTIQLTPTAVKSLLGTNNVWADCGQIKEGSYVISKYSGMTATVANYASSATKATQDESGNNIKSSYASSISISDHTITLKNKNGVSLGTVTVPDNVTDNTKLPLAGGTMTGQIVLSSTGFKTSNTGGYTVDQYGNFKHQSSDTSQYWNIQNNAGTNKFSVYWETGNVTAAGAITASKFIGVNEADLKWGGANFAGSYGCIDAALMDELGANRFQFIKASAITVEYSRDGGSTWTDYGATDAQKQQIFAQGGGLIIGKADSTHKATEHPGQYQLRITIDTGVANVYTYLNKFVIYVSTSGSANCACKIQKALQSTPTTFVDHTDWISVTGWSGYNVLNTSYLPTYGNSASSQYGRVRFIFKDGEGGSTNYVGLSVLQIKAFGGVGWNCPSTMAKTGHIYSYNENQTAIFPHHVHATEFYENNVALSSKYFALSGGTITGVPKFASGSISAFSDNIPYILGIESFANGGTVKWKASSDVVVGSATTATTATTAVNLSGFKNTTSTATAVNDAITNGHYYVNGTSDIYNISDGAAYVQAYSSSWVGQIYQDYRTGQIALRGKNNGTWQAWRKVWDSVNLTSKTAATSGTDLSLVTTGEKALWNAKSDFSGSYNDLTNKPTIPTVTDTYSATGTNATSGKAVAAALGTLDVTTSGASASKTLTALSQTDGKISATFGNISITKSQVSDFPTLGTASAKNYTTSVTSGSADLVTSGAVYTAIDNLPEPMVFKGSLGTGGTITTLPTNGTASIGDTYKVITDGTYAGKTAKLGDTFICLTKTSSANTWELIPSGDEPSGTVTSITIGATSPIAINDSSAITTSGTRTISHANSGVTAGTYRSVTVNATGHVTAGTNPTTLSGYGITDAKIASGVITLGSNTITPLTASSTLNAAKLSGTIPSGCYTDTNNAVTQTATDSASSDYEILFSGTGDNTTRTEGARKTSALTYNPSVKALNLSGANNSLISIQADDGNDGDQIQYNTSRGNTYQFQNNGIFNIFYSDNSYASMSYLDFTISNVNVGSIGLTTSGSTPDITLDGTTWDGTNTSLKSSISAVKTTADNALPKSGGTMTGTIVTPSDDNKGIEPATNNYGYVGSSSKKFFRMYASTFYGDLDGKIKQSATSTSTSNAYPVLFSGSTSTSSGKYDVYRQADLTYNPSTKILLAKDGTGDLQASIDPVLGGFVAESVTNSQKCKLFPNDVILEGNTWDGTNTSLKTAIGSIRSSYLPLTGGTMTGALEDKLMIHKANEPFLELHNDAITIGTTSNNGVTTSTYPAYRVCDSNGVAYAHYRGIGYNNGDNAALISVNNKKTDGTYVENGFWIFARKDGTINYQVSNPDNFRKAINAGHRFGTSSAAGTTFTVPTNSTWLIITGHNSTGALNTAWIVRCAGKVTMRIAAAASGTYPTITCPATNQIKVALSGATVDVYGIQIG